MFPKEREQGVKRAVSPTASSHLSGERCLGGSKWMLFNIYSAVTERRDSPVMLCSVLCPQSAPGEM